MPRKSSSSSSFESSQELHAMPIPMGKESFVKQIKHFVSDSRFRIVCGVLLCAFSLFSIGAVISYLFTGSADASLLHATAVDVVEDGVGALSQYQNCFGRIGAVYAHWLVDGTFGLASILLIVMMALYGLRLLHVTSHPGVRLFLLSAFWMVWASYTLGYLQSLFHLNLFFRLGGIFGEWSSIWLTSYVYQLGSALIIVVLAIIFLVLTTAGFVPMIHSLWEKLHRRSYRSEMGQEGECEMLDKEENRDVLFHVSDERHGGEESDKDASVVNPPLDIQIEPISTSTEDLPITLSTDAPVLTIESTGDGMSSSVDDVPANADVEIVPAEGVEIVEQMEDYDPHKDLSFYQYPPLELLKVYDNETAPVIDQVEQQANANRIVNTLRNYEVEVESIKATVGPTVTLYEIVPKAGTRISRIQNLENDIMLSLSAIGIRIIAPMPGKGTVGIEVPNEKPQVVSMHSVIASKRFQEEQKMKLPVAIGRTITNEVFCFDLAKTPHLLVAGATGQGKSVGLNAIITSLLYKKHPSELKFVLVDPKMVEFSVYKPLIRHYMAAMPDQEDRDIIITDSQKVINTLNSLVIEMEDRYSLLADASVRTLEDYNEKFIHRQLNPEKVVENLVTHKPLHHHFMPYIVIIIDEYGDFIMVSGKEVERPIQRLTQKARAVGMHMVLATQRPDVKIVTGTIKANVPTRIAFRTQSVVDSRTVLDAKGADQLIGKGDMLYSGGGTTTRIQCAFVDTPEVEKIVEHISEQQHYSMPYQLPEYVPEGGDASDTGGQPGQVDMKRLDPMFAEVARYVVNKQEGSTSRLQRAFEIGYNRAGKLSDQLEAAGVVGPNKGPKGRDVLIQDPESLENLLQSLGL